MLKISVVIITFNEQLVLEKTIKAARKISDDIIIVDSYSTDKTIEIAQYYGVRVFQRKWDSYSKQKNFGNNQAYNDFVFSLDADEILSDELIDSIKSLSDISRFDAYKLKRVNILFGKRLNFGANKNERIVRLFNKNKISWNNDLVHEGLEVKNNSISNLKGELLHYTYSDMEDYINKTNIYTSLHSKQMFDKGIKANFIKLYLSPTFSFIKNYFFRLGFLDGFEGFYIAIQSANYVYLKYSKLALLYKNAKK